MTDPMTIDQLIAELHERREALVAKGYPESSVEITVKATPDGFRISGWFFCGQDKPRGLVEIDGEQTPERVLARLDAMIAEARERPSADTVGPWFDVAQLEERAAS
jgi:hypothetical protein